MFCVWAWGSILLLLYRFIPVWILEVSPSSLLLFLKCVVVFKPYCIWGVFFCIWTVNDSLFMYIYWHFRHSSGITFMSLIGPCQPWWLVMLLLKHLKIVINGIFFLIAVIYIPVLCSIRMVCYIFATKYYSYCSIWQKALANYICLKYSHTKFRICFFCYIVFQGNTWILLEKYCCLFSLLMQWVEVLIDPMFVRHL